MSAESPTPPPPQPSLIDRLRAAPVSTVLFAVCIIVFVLAERAGSTQSSETLIRFGANYRSGVWHGEWWRLFTSMFLHIGVVHLVWNLWAGLSWTAPFERIVGPWRFLFIYLVSGLVGSAASIIGHDAVSAGASGALFGVMGGQFVLLRATLGGWRALWAEPGLRRMLGMTVAWLAIGPFVGFDSFAHGGGLLAGMALTSGFLRGGQYRLPVAVFCCAVAVVCATRPLPVLHDDWVDVRAIDAAWARRDWKEVVALTGQVKRGERLAPFRAEALIGLGREQEAGALLSTTAEQLAEAAWLASLLERTGQGDRAKLCLEDALARAPNELELQWALHQLLSRRHDPKARQLAEQIVRAHPKSAQALGLQARLRLSEGEREEGLDLLRQAAALSPDPWRFEYVMALIDAGRRQAARAELAGAPNPQFLECWVTLVEGDYAGATSCDALEGKSERSLKALRLVGLGQCGAALTMLGDNDDELAVGLRAVCALRETPTTSVPGPDGVVPRLLRFSVTRDLADLEGLEDDAKNSWLWPLLPAEARRVLPREAGSAAPAPDAR